jgi:hypothetical protein
MLRWVLCLPFLRTGRDDKSKRTDQKLTLGLPIIRPSGSIIRPTRTDAVMSSRPVGKMSLGS